MAADTANAWVPSVVYPWLTSSYAAFQIQTVFRAHTSYKHLLQLCGKRPVRCCSAARHIQAAWRHHRFCLDQLQLDDDAMTSFVYSQLKKAREVESAARIQAVWRGKSVRMSFDTADISPHPDLETYTDASGHWQKCNPKDWVISSGIVDGRLWWDPLKEEVWYLIGSGVIVPYYSGKDPVRPTTRQTTSVAAIKRWYGYEKPAWD